MILLEQSLSALYVGVRGNQSMRTRQRDKRTRVPALHLPVPRMTGDQNVCLCHCCGMQELAYAYVCGEWHVHLSCDCTKRSCKD